LFERFDSKAQELSSFREEIVKDLQAFLETSAEQYGVKSGGIKGGVTLTSFDGVYKIQISNNDVYEFTEELQTARELINECVKNWTKESRSEIKVLIDNAFKVDKQGMVSTSRILGLRQLNIGDSTWQKAMSAITDSIKVASSRKYLRFYKKDTDGKYQLQNLDVCAL
ncbi:MAG: DUF3164 family protein, partial [Treponemataceae bacterium]